MEVKEHNPWCPNIMGNMEIVLKTDKIKIETVLKDLYDYNASIFPPKEYSEGDTILYKSSERKLPLIVTYNHHNEFSKYIHPNYCLGNHFPMTRMVLIEKSK